MTLPTLFISHGSRMMAVEAGKTGDFLRKLGEELPRPKAILCVSAHWMTEAPVVAGTAKPETIHDFYGFPEALYRIRYPAPGAADLAMRTQELLQGTGCVIDPDYGLDHGAWVPLSYLYPKADIPVAQLSVQPYRDAAWHFRLGEALAPLREEGVLILGSGSSTHNLRELHRGSDAVVPWAAAFDDWLGRTLEDGKTVEALDWVEAAPQALRAHPTPEHFLPLFVPLGAAHGAAGRRINTGFSSGTLSLSAFAFGG